MKILILLGAGASVPSGIPSFRGESAGQFDFNFFNINYIKKANKNKDKTKINEIINFYKKIRIDFSNKKENEYHDFIKKLSKKEDCTIISQNIDNLDINLNNIVKIHGNLSKNRCLNNPKHIIKNNLDIGDKCNKCNSLIIPDILYYEENYNKKIIAKVNKIKKEKYDLFIIIGSSLDIGFVNQLVQNIQSDHKININPEISLREYGFLQYSNFYDFYNSVGNGLLT